MGDYYDSDFKAHQLLAEWDSLMLADRYPHPARILTALRLAPDLDTCIDLLTGRPVDPARLDQQELERAKHRKLVRLDMTALDELEAA